MKYTINDGFPYYIELVGDQAYLPLFQAKESIKLFNTLSEGQAGFRYAPGKWSLKQILGHMTDHERIMTYRALRFSRKDQTSLPGYEQNDYVENSLFDELPVTQLVQDFENVRNATLSFIGTLSKDQLALTGTAWKYVLTVEEFLKATIGHELHHLGVVREKYLV